MDLETSRIKKPMPNVMLMKEQDLKRKKWIDKVILKYHVRSENIDNNWMGS